MAGDRNFRKRFNYLLDNFISKGFWAQFALLFVVILIIVMVFGVIAGLISSQFSVGTGIWLSLMHIIDQGTISGDELGDGGYITVMLIVTLLGMAFTGTIVGIINNAMSNKLDELKKGHSQIVESGHIVVIGFDDNLYTILSEIEESNENWKGNKKTVVIDDMPKEEMEFTVKEHRRALQKVGESGFVGNDRHGIPNVIFRSGNVISENTFEIASAEKARAIIINKDDDFDVLRIILALTSYLKQKGAYLNAGEEADRDVPTVVTLMHEKENISAAAIAAGVYHDRSKGDQAAANPEESKFRILYFEDILAHIFAQVCRQPGLSWVIAEIFDYAANSEIYIEDTLKDSPRGRIDELLEGRSFREICEGMTDSIALGIRRGDEVILNPDPDREKFQKGDKIIHLAEDDNCMCIDPEHSWNAVGAAPEVRPGSGGGLYNFLILGWSIPLPDVITNIGQYAPAGSRITILSKHEDETARQFICPYQQKRKQRRAQKDIRKPEGVEVIQERMDPYDWNAVSEYLDHRIDWDNRSTRPTNIVIMCQDGVDKAEADEKAAVLLLNMRKYLQDNELDDKITITAEMNLPEDQKLLMHTSVNDFIVGSEIANRMMVQVANDPYMFKIFRELLNQYGSEIYLRRFDEYVNIKEQFNFRYIQKAAADRAELGKDKQEIALGWINLRSVDTVPNVHLNPSRKEMDEVFRIGENDAIENYRVVVLAGGDSTPASAAAGTD